jgi:hypothetical protein
MRHTPTSLAGQLPALGDLKIDEGPTFVEILAAQREARRVVDGETGQGEELWCEAAPHIDRPTVALTDGERPASESSEAVSCNEARRRINPRVVSQGMLEYALVAILVAIVLIVLLGTVGHQAQNVFSTLSRGLAT